MSKLYTLLDTLIGKVNCCVKIYSQRLTIEQQAQARKNIGAQAELTDADKEAIVQQVVDALPVYNGEVV